ncbi:Uma2 family endonuclease [Chamaesiphon sp. VAR_48_metabat_403]|uniref:Uma2 family endonuclease n=1 Tax=Chamaesiphon sp. VAR_48_metabat_403 TaxID=2964700 RepID=UPI00286E584D|nr:Uma2 family endonuclease [Chamaesiphon sp. VAR_48_metabat_403]
MTISASEHFPQFTPVEYLEWEAQQELRYEFVDGRISAMTIESVEHDRIATNFCNLLQAHLQATVCRVFNSKVKVQTLASNAFCYPDLSVSGDVRDRSANNFITHPCLIVEVVSPRSEVYDRGEKFALYRQTTTFSEYVLVSTDKIWLDLHQRNDLGNWALNSYASGDEVALKSVNFTFDLDRIYEDRIVDIGE